MPADVAELRIKVVSDDVKKADRRLGQLDKQSKKVERSTKKMNRSFVGLGVGILGVAVATKTLWSIFNNVRTLEKLNARLITATGSMQNAKIQMNELQETATKMPQTLAEITDAFIIMKNLGLTPTEESLLSFANTASATGKTLDQFVQAVADAITFEFERLKEFGIRARQEGDKIRFIFQGASTTVGKNAKEIEGFLRGLGETEFAGGIALQMDTIDGKLSNLSDAWFNFTNTLTDGKFIGSVIDKATSFFRNVTDVNELSSFADRLSDATAKGLEDGATKGFSRFERLTALRNVEQTGLTGRVGIEGIPMLEKLIEVRKLVAAEQRFGFSEIARPVNQEQTKFLEDTLVILKQQKTAQDALNTANEDTQRLKAGQWAIEGATNRRLLERLSITDQLAKAQDKELGSLVDLALGIDKNGDKINVDVVERRLMAEEKLIAQLSKKAAVEKERADAFILSLKSEEEQINAGYDRQIDSLNTFLENKQITMQEAADAQIELEKQKIESLRNLDQVGLTGRLGTARDFFGQMAIIAQGENEKLFKINKAFALADAIVSGVQSVQNAMADMPWPANLAAAAMAAVETGINVATIKSTTFAGNFAHGGVVGGGSFSGDNVQANVNSGEMILNRAQQGQLFAQANGGGGGSPKVVVNNYGVETTVNQRQDDQGRQIIELTNRITQSVQATINQDLVRGDGPTSRSLQVAMRRNGR